MESFICIIFFMFGNLALLVQSSKPSPFILVPGFAGSQLEAKVTAQLDTSFYCIKPSKDFFLVWPNPIYMTNPTIKCLSDIMSMTFNSTAGKANTAKGVQIRAPDFGSTKRLEFANNFLFFVPRANHMHDVVQSLQKATNLRKDYTIRGAPYDFRLSFNQQEEYYNNLQKLVEETYLNGGDEKVVLMGHSMGCLAVLRFLQTRSQEWKDKYIAAFVSVNGPYGGAIELLYSIVEGRNAGISTFSPSKLRHMQRTFPSTYLMLPNSHGFKSTDSPLMRGPRGQSYTIEDFESGKLFKDIGYPEGYEIYKSVQKDLQVTVDPGVKVYCVDSAGLPTPRILSVNDKDWGNKVSDIINGDGDGMVNLESLRACGLWNQRKTVDNDKLRINTFYKAEHFEVLKDDRFLKLLVAVAKKEY